MRQLSKVKEKEKEMGSKNSCSARVLNLIVLKLKVIKKIIDGCTLCKIVNKESNQTHNQKEGGNLGLSLKNWQIYVNIFGVKYLRYLHINSCDSALLT